MTLVYSAVKALVESQGKFLLIKIKVGDKVFYDLPGGRIQHGENPYDALVREVKEEVYLDVTIQKSLGLWWFFRARDGDQVVCNTFLCESKSINVDLEKNPDEQEEVSEYMWLAKEELLAFDEYPHESLKKLVVSYFSE